MPVAVAVIATLIVMTTGRAPAVNPVLLLTLIGICISFAYVNHVEAPVQPHGDENQAANRRPHSCDSANHSPGIGARGFRGGLGSAFNVNHCLVLATRLTHRINVRRFVGRTACAASTLIRNGLVPR